MKLLACALALAAFFIAVIANPVMGPMGPIGENMEAVPFNDADHTVSVAKRNAEPASATTTDDAAAAAKVEEAHADTMDNDFVSDEVSDLDESRKKRSVSESSMSAVAAAERKKRSIEEVAVERKKRSLDFGGETAAERLLEQVRMMEMREALKHRLAEELAAEEDESSSDEESSSDDEDEVQKRSEYEDDGSRSMLIRVAGEPGLFVPLDALRADEDDDDESSSASESSEEDAAVAKRGYDTEDYYDESDSDEEDESSEEEDERKQALLRELILEKMREQDMNAVKRSYYENDEADEEDDDDSDERRDLIREYMVLDSLARALVENRQK